MSQWNPQHTEPKPDLPMPHRPVALIAYEPPTAWKSAPTAVRFAVWVWAISVIASIAGFAFLIALFALGMNLAILGGN